MRCSSTALSWTTSICRSQRFDRPLTRTGQHTQFGDVPHLVYRKTKLPPPPKPAAKAVQTIVQQTVIRLTPVTHCHIRQQAISIQHLSTNAFLLLAPPPTRRTGREDVVDPARPTQTAQRLLRLFSVESAQRQLRPFYSRIVRHVLNEEQERYKSRPTQAISLIWNLFGRRQAFRTLTRFYFSAVEKLGSNYYPALHGQNALYLAAGVVLHSRIYQHHVRQLWNRENTAVPLRYARRPQTLADNLVQLQVKRRVLPPREPLEEMVHTQSNDRPPREPPQTQKVQLSEADFRALVQGVASSLGRQTRLEALRQGGM